MNLTRRKFLGGLTGSAVIAATPLKAETVKETEADLEKELDELARQTFNPNSKFVTIPAGTYAVDGQYIMRVLKTGSIPLRNTMI